MAVRRKIDERVSGSPMQNQDMWFLIKEDEGEAMVVQERFCREKGEKEFRRVDERRMSMGEAMSQGGKLAKNLWYAIPE